MVSSQVTGTCSSESLQPSHIYRAIPICKPPLLTFKLMFRKQDTLYMHPVYQGHW